MSKCRICKGQYVKRSMGHKACSVECAKALVVQNNEKNQRKSDRLRKEKLLTRNDHIKLTQKAFNAYIRARDHHKPCISSGRTYLDHTRNGGSLMDAGHYRSIGSASHLRFNLLNCHSQSVKDNRDLSGNIVEYRKGLIDRIGLERTEALENDNQPRKFDINYLLRLRQLMNKRARYYRKRRGI